jgi:hypothetical protein
MWKEDKDKEGKKFIEEYKKGIKSGKDYDSGIHRDSKPKPNEYLNELVGAPKGTIIKPVEMPSLERDSESTVDLPGIGAVKRKDIKGVPFPEYGKKKGGAIDLSKCKVNTAKKNSSSSNW